MKAAIVIPEKPIDIGCDWEGFGLRFRQPNGQPLDLTGVDGRSQLRSLTGELLADINVERDLEQMVVWLSLPRAITATLQGHSKGNYDLLLQDSLGKRLKYVKGSIPIQGTFTQWAE